MTSNELTVRYERIDKISLITLDRVPINVYDGLFDFHFQSAWRQARNDSETNVVVMQATGRHFCAGANMRNAQPAPDNALVLPAWDEISLIKDTAKPTIAAVQGACMGGGQRKVWPCDIIYCTEDAYFRDPTASMGIGGIQSHVHTWLYGPRLAKEMIYSGDPIPATRLYAAGHINRLFPDADTLRAETMAFAQRIAEQDPEPLRQAKRAVDMTMDIMGQHYVTSRMRELMDVHPEFRLGSR
jgi:enoyl-CoA hydratase